MKGQWTTATALAWRDWRHEYLLSLCAMLALASMLAPLLILQGLKNGIVSGMRERLLQDPTALVITPKSDDGRFDAQFIASLAHLPGASYAVGRIRATASDLTLDHPAQRTKATIGLEPSTEGEPVLKRYGMPTPSDGPIPELILSSGAAKSLKAEPGSTLHASLGRRTAEGKLESQPLELRVIAILPPEAADRKLAFVPLTLMEAMEDYRDNIAVPHRNFTGSPAPGPRQYASFRLYAASLDQVAPLAAYLEGKNIEVITKSRDIAAIQALEQAINQIILIISVAVGAGFLAFTFSSAESAARRKRRMLGMLRLLGFQRGALVCFPAVQCVLTAIGGFGVAIIIYVVVATAIAQAFAARGGINCHLSIPEALVALATVALLSALASLRSAWQAAALEPSLVIRDI